MIDNKLPLPLNVSETLKTLVVFMKYSNEIFGAFLFNRVEGDVYFNQNVVNFKSFCDFNSERVSKLVVREIDKCNGDVISQCFRDGDACDAVECIVTHIQLDQRFILSNRFLQHVDLLECEVGVLQIHID